MFISSDKSHLQKVIKSAAKELRDLQSFEVTSILTIIESGTKILNRTIELLENDSDLVQACHYSGKSSYSVTLTNLNDSKKKTHKWEVCTILIDNGLNGSYCECDH